MTALSRTLMLTTWPQANPPQPSPRSGPSGLRARVGFRPNTPEAEAGIRIEPPPSLACATGRMRAATAAAAPPDDPPEECSRISLLQQNQTLPTGFSHGRFYCVLWFGHRAKPTAPG